jgi:hypothetical protein
MLYSTAKPNAKGLLQSNQPLMLTAQAMAPHNNQTGNELLEQLKESKLREQAAMEDLAAAQAIVEAETALRLFLKETYREGRPGQAAQAVALQHGQDGGDSQDDLSDSKGELDMSLSRSASERKVKA